MRVLITNGHLAVGGVEKSLVNLLNAIDYSEMEVDLLLFEGYGDYLDQIPQQVRVILFDITKTYGSFSDVFSKAIKERDFRSILLKTVLTLSSRISIRCMSWMRFFHITDHTYDCAIAYRVGMPTDYVAYTASAKKKYMWWHHGEFDYSDYLVDHWNDCAKRMDGIVCVSESTKKMITPHFPGMKNRIKVIPNMINPDEIHRFAQEFHPYESRSQIIIVSVGRMSAEKKMIHVVYAAKKLMDSGYSNFKWHLIGDGAEYQTIREAICVNHLEQKIICMGNQKNPYPYIADADIFVHPSYVESQGITVLEAMALEKCIVVTRSNGVEEFVENGKNAYLVEQSVDSMVEMLVELFNTNIALKTDQLREGQRGTVKLFSAEENMRKIMRLI